MAREILNEDLTRRQKFRAERVEHFYYQKPHPWRSWMKRVSWGLPALALLFMVGSNFVASGSRLYLPGPVSTKHRIFGDHCAECHGGGPGEWGKVGDGKCLGCHDGPLHHPNMKHPGGNLMRYARKGVQKDVETPACASCHSEHHGSQQLSQIADRHCVQCHAQLAGDPKPAFQSGILGFSQGHPEWKVLRDKEADKTPIRLNHKKHLALKWSPSQIAARAKVDPRFEKVPDAPLSCLDCHHPDAQRAYMEPLRYEMHCGSCHPLVLNPVLNVGEVPIPHDRPNIVASVVKTAFSDHLIRSGGKLPARLAKNPNYVKPKPGRKATAPEFLEEPDPRSPELWVKESVAATLDPLFFPPDPRKVQGTCLECHFSSGKDPASGLPLLVEPRIPSVWLTHSVFDHQSHRVLECRSCHPQALLSEKTEDVLLPGLAACSACHSPQGGARSGCVECHIYHDKSLSNFSGMRDIQELILGLEAAGRARAAQPPSDAPSPPPPALPVTPATPATPAAAPATPGQPATPSGPPPSGVGLAETNKAPAGPSASGQPPPATGSQPALPGPRAEPPPAAGPPAATAPSLEEPKAPGAPGPAQPAPAAGAPTSGPGAVKPGGSSDSKLCPNCGLRAPGRAHFCGRCGMGLGS